MPDSSRGPQVTDVGRLAPAEWERLQELADRFEAAWNAADAEAKSVGLADFLPPPQDPLRPAALRELIKSELEIRWRRGQPALLEQYIADFPELGPRSSLSPRLIYEEYRVRRLYGDQPAIATYRVRFPEQAAEVERMTQVEVTPAGPVRGVSTPSARPITPSQSALPSASTVLSVGGGYRLIQRIGAGGFGEVWSAEAPGGVEVAIKIISRPIDHAEAQRELQALELIRGLRHPFLLQTQAYWSLEDRLLIVMALADGNLRGRLKECQEKGLEAIPVDELLDYFREAAEGLDFLHTRGVQHRDIKPDNILLLQGHAQLADFGLARLQGTRSMMTASGSGSPPYMAPELWRGKVSPHSDQYSLAVTYAELRRGRRPFSGRDMVEMMLDHMDRKPNLDPLPEAEQRVLHRALDKDASKRFPTCKEFLVELERAVHGTVTRTPVPTPDTASLAGAAGTVPSLRPSLPGAAGASQAPRPTPGDWRKPAPTAPGLPLRWIAAGGILCMLIAAAALALWRPRTSDTGKQPPSPPTPPGAWLPSGSGWSVASGAAITETDGRQLADAIALERGRVREVFRLVPADAHRPVGGDASFYIMENKVSRRLFRLAVNDPEFTTLLQQLGADSPQAVQRAWAKGLASEADDGLPLFNVTVTEAYAFAQWLGGKRGQLPTGSQWEKAAGCLDAGHQWPLRQPSTTDTPADTPLPVDRPHADVTWYGCRDMTGNGREWTRDLVGEPRRVPLSNPRANDMVRICGRGPGKPPLSCADIVDRNHPQEESYFATHPLIGFRVVLEIPDSP